MKNLIALLLTIFAFSASAQDNIVLRNGEEIKAKVQEVGTTEIKYKKADNPNGPLYTTSKSEVLMIKYENGSKDVFSSSGAGTDNLQGYSPQSKGAALSDYERYRKLAKRRTIAGGIMTGLGVHSLIGGVVLIGAGLNSSYDYSGPGGGGSMNMGGPMLAGAGLASAALGTALTIVGAINLAKGTKYKKMARAAQQPTMGFTPINNKELDRYTQGYGGQTLGSVTFTF